MPSNRTLTNGPRPLFKRLQYNSLPKKVSLVADSEFYDFFFRMMVFRKLRKNLIFNLFLKINNTISKWFLIENFLSCHSAYPYAVRPRYNGPQYNGL